MSSVSDEEFWRKQERRRDRQLGQPCCTQSGMSWSMIDMPGNFAVVIHGEFDCVNCFHHQQGRSAIQYYSTRLSEAQLTTGRTEEPLRRCLELIAETQKPDGIVVLGTCPVEVIGDQFPAVVNEVSARTGVPMLPLRTNGLKLGTQAEMLDWLNDSLASFSKTTTTPVENRVNLVGLPGRGRAFSEARKILGGADIEVNGVYPHAAGFDSWCQISNAKVNGVVDSGMYPKLLKRLRGFGHDCVDLPYPAGLGATSRFYAGLIDQFRGEGAGAAHVEPYVERLLPRLEKFKADFTGVRIAYAMRMKNTYSIANVAYDGLGFVSALLEMGLEVELLIQGAPDPDAQAAYADKLSQRGIDLPFHVFSSPPAVIDILRRGDYQLTYLSDSSRQEAQRAGVAFLGEELFSPFFSGVPRTLLGFRRILQATV